MIIEYDVVCFERTLQITFPKKYESLKDEIVNLIDRLYTFWHDTESSVVQSTCLEEFIMDRLAEMHYKWKEWESIPYGDDYEPRETLWVCEHCLCAIESREGNQAILRHSVDETDAVDSRCGWCKSCGHDVLYELI